ncbi:RDD family protein [Nonomuraea sp. B12E4]|uniref:RDD family protein n=1 Tax=Nonomuraea sp. B12E4 TaxID=3153564 RepID=UPI00325DCD24
MGSPPPGLAGRWRRLFAGVLDWLIVNLLTAPLGWASWKAAWDAGRGVWEGYTVQHTFAAALVGFLYFWLLHSFWNGQTPGKKVFGIRVVQDDGAKIQVGQTAVRQAVASVFEWLCGIGILLDLGWILFDPRKQALHDKAARTVVVYA